MAQPDDQGLDRFAVDRWTDLAGGFTSRRPRLMRRLGNLETRLLRDEIEGIEIDRPIFIAGLARSGSTILLECLAEHPDAATHRYRDYPGVMAPIAWSRLTDRLLAGREVRAERAHADGIEVTPESPEAIEEMIWMAFFEGLHDPSRSSVLDETTANPAFAAFYREHVRKLLWLRAGRRYVSKGNYNLTRLAYLQQLFPDARFVVPVREPLWHVASLMKQHALFCAAEERHPGGAALHAARRAFRVRPRPPPGEHRRQRGHRRDPRASAGRPRCAGPRALLGRGSTASSSTSSRAAPRSERRRWSFATRISAARPRRPSASCSTTAGSSRCPG